MTTQPIPTCGEHHTPKEWRKAVFEYRDNGILIQVPDINAWVCPEDGEASFTPETVDELIATVRELFEIAKRAQQRRSVLTEYIVSVG
jgi:RNA polymerase subunit RPABC4/transcription elongation factor Spt4